MAMMTRGQGASIYRRGRTFWLDVTINGERFRVSLHVTKWNDAQQAARKKIAAEVQIVDLLGGADGARTRDLRRDSEYGRLQSRRDRHTVRRSLQTNHQVISPRSNATALRMPKKGET